MKLQFLLTIAIAAQMTTVSAMFEGPQVIPVDRLLKDTETYIATNPDSDEAHYILARIHYLAFARNSTSVLVFNIDNQTGLPFIAPDWLIGETHSNELDETKLAAHASDALAAFRKLVKKNPDTGLYLLGLGKLLEQVVDWKEQAKPVELPEALEKTSRDQARDAYLAAFRASFGKDSQWKSRPPTGVESLVSYQAGTAFLRMTKEKADAVSDLSIVKKEITEGLAKLEVIPPVEIAPEFFDESDQ